MTSPRYCVPALAVILGACSPAEDGVPTSAGLVVDTIASPATLPARVLGGGTVLADGRLALADVAAGVVWLVAGDATPPASLGSPGTADGQLQQPLGVVTIGDTIVVVNAGNGRLERYSPEGTSWGSIPVAADLLSGPIEILPSGRALVTTLGRDSSLARLHALDGGIIQRYGRVMSAPAGALNPAALKAEIQNGGIPEVFRNVVLPVPGTAGEVWLVLHTEGRIERLAEDGSLLAQVTLAEDELAPVREEFFRANSDPDQPGALFAFVLAAAGVADAEGVWFLLAGAPSRSAVLLRVRNDGTIAERLAVAESRGARLLLRDHQRDIFYLINQEDGTVVRVRRAAA